MTADLTTPTVRLPAPGTYQVDTAASRLDFTTRHMFGLAAVRGSLAVAGGRITITEAPEDSVVEASVHAATFDTGSSSRDKLIRSTDWLDPDTHPDITFHADRLLRTDDGWTARGAVTARGVSAPVDLVIISVTEQAGVVTATARATVDRYAHGLTKAKGLAARRLHLQLTVRASRT